MTNKAAKKKLKHAIDASKKEKREELCEGITNNFWEKNCCEETLGS